MTREDDAARVAAIEGYGVLESRPRGDLRALVDLAALVCDVPMATINLITADEQHQVAAVGFEAGICRREDSMCASILHAGTPVVVPDASADPRFRDNPFVTGEIGDVRFYASHQLCTPQGVVIGTLCVFDDKPRTLRHAQVGALSALAARVVDVLELELAGRRLAAANAELARSHERLAAFAGQISHDLKNPLAAITMSLELARDEAADAGGDQLLVSLLDRATRGADRMDSMIGDLLAFARGGADPHPEPVDLGEVVGHVLEDLHDAAEGVEVTVGELPNVAGDPAQVRALVQNLLANAMKFTRGGAAPAVTVGARPAQGGGWRTEVTDNGPGIEAADRERVFEPFTRIDKSVPGTGIGLSTCRRIVEAHGGRIGLEGAPGGGTRAWFELPDA